MDGKPSQISKTDSSYVIQEERFTWELYNEIYPLLEEHWAEIADDTDKIKLHPDTDIYFLLEQQKKLHCLICRLNGKIVGYSVTFLNAHAHYSDKLFAQNDILFIHKDHRKGSLGFKLIRLHEKCMKELGVTAITYHLKPKKDFSKLLERIDYTLFEISYRKYIGE